jgi:NAD(P)-dependent dehydrogenase (short-subunit alcohol dehydrogenase family)
VALHPTVVVLGATGAIGSAVAAVLARGGAHVVLMARPTDRLDALVKKLEGEDKRISSVPVDLASMKAVRAAARTINNAGGHIDAMLNAAAVFVPRYKKTAEGFELMLAINHLGPFLLSNLLRDRLLGGGRIITVAAPSNARVDMTRLLDRQRFRALQNFAATKAANLMFTFELARRGKRWDVRANAFHPGLVRSDLMREAPRPARLISRLGSGSADHAAMDLAELAISPAYAGTTGWFFKGTRRIDPPRNTVDAPAQGALWRRSAELVELEELGY